MMATIDHQRPSEALINNVESSQKDFRPQIIIIMAIFMTRDQSSE